MKVKLRATIEREIEVSNIYAGCRNNLILEDYVFGHDGLMADTSELLNGMTWEVVSRIDEPGGVK